MDPYSNSIKVSITSYNEEVTGSNNHVKVNWPDGREITFLVDCGLFQEPEHNYHNFEKFFYNAENVKFAILTHAHTDHVGRLPFLVKNGFSGKMYSTMETARILPVVLNETAERLDDEYRGNMKFYSKQKEEKKSRNCKRGKGKRDKPRRDKKKKKEEKIQLPRLIYTKQDIPSCLKLLETVELYETFSPCEGLGITFYPNAHIGGAVIVVCHAYFGTEDLYFLFTGDLGLDNPVTHGITDVPKEVADKVSLIVSESTYGSGKYAKDFEAERKKHINIIRRAHEKNGTIMYMSNSLERPQRVASDLLNMYNDERIKDILPNIPIYLDSTFGLKCHSVYLKLYGAEYLPENFSTIDKNTREEAVFKPGTKMVICTSPRFYQGSFLNYASRVLSNPNVTLVFVAYITDKVRNIVNLPRGSKIMFMGEEIELKCKMETLSCYSSHVSIQELDGFLNNFKNVNTILFNHGTSDSKVNCVKRYVTEKTNTHSLLYGRTVVATNAGIQKYY